ncbi:MAG: ZIP family metal transporter [bacterium]|nr:ZIP family metal transporter [bacterium]
MPFLLPVLGLVTLGSLAGLLGGILLLAKRSWARSLSIHAIPFAAGSMLAVSLLDILPEAIEKSSVEVVFPIILIVIVVAFFFEQFFIHIHHHEEHKRTTVRSSLPLLVAGDTIHNFVDGLAIAAAYLVDPSLGILVALATFFHEIPQEMGDIGLMIAGGWSRRRALFANVISAFASYLGALIVVLSLSTFEHNLGIVLAIAGGIFLYIGASDLLPEVQETHKDSPWHQAGLLISGVLLIWILSRVVPA